MKELIFVLGVLISLLSFLNIILVIFGIKVMKKKAKFLMEAA